MTTRQTKADLLRENRQLRKRIAALERPGPADTGSRDAEARLRLALIVESSDDAIIATSPEGVVESWNRAAESLFGYTAKEAIGQDFTDLVVPSGRLNRMLRKFASLRRGRRNGHEETELRRKDGSTVAVSEVATPIVDGSGKVVGASINLRDISARKADEANLRMFRSLLDMSGDAIEVIDPETHRFIEVNATACRTLGYSRAELLSMRVPDINPEVSEASLQRVDRGLRKRRTLLFETVHRRKDGAVFPIELSISKVKLERPYYVVVARDISERRQEEARHRTIFEGMLDGVGIIDLATRRFVDANQALCRMLGYSHDEITRRHVPAIHPRKDWPAVVEQFDRQAAGDVRLIESVPMKRKDGSLFYADISSSLVELGGKRYMVGVVRDITERLASETSLKLFRELIDQSKDAIEVVDPDSLRFIDVNTAAIRTLGYSRDELLSMGVQDVDPDLDQLRANEIEKTLQDHGSVVIETSHRRKDGSVFPVEASISLVQADKLYRVAVVRDISERKRAEQVILDEKAFTDAVIQHLPGFFYRMDQSGHVLQWNQYALDMMELTPEEMAKANALAFIDEEDRPTVTRELGKTFETGSGSAEAHITTKDGVRDYALSAARVGTGKEASVVALGVDITGLKQAEARLRESEERLRAILEGVLDGIVLVNVKTRRVVDGNTTACRMFGYSHDEFIGLKVPDLHPKQDWPSVRERFAKQARGELPLAVDMPVKRKDGSVFYADINTSTMDLGGEPHMVGIFHDITERKQSEERLQLFRTLLDSSSDCIEVLDPATMSFLDVNETECRILGYSREEMLSMHVDDINVEFSADMLKAVQKQIQEAGEARFESMHRRKDGSTFPVEVNVTMVEVDRPYMLAVVRDITERKEAEEALRESEHAYRTLTQNLPGSVYRVFIQEHSRMEFYNDMISEITGYTADEMAPGGICSIEPLMLDQDRPGVVNEVRRAVAEKRPFAVEYRLRHKDGSIRWLSERGMPVRGPDGKPLYIDGVIFDVTERKQAEDRLHLFRALLDHSNDGIEVLEPETFLFLDVNKTGCRALGYSREELLSMSVLDIDPAFDDAARAAFNKALQKTGRARFEGVHRRKDGSTFPVEVSTTRINLDKPYLLTVARDISERKKAEAILDRANRALRVLSACNLALVQASTEDELLHGVVDAIVNMSGYKLAVVDFVGNDPEKSITPIAWSAATDVDYWAQGMSWGNTKYGKLPVSRAIRSGKTQFCHDIAGDPGFKPWRDAVLARGLVSNIALPLSEHGKVFGVLSIYSPDQASFDDAEEIRLLEELAGDLAYGITTMRTRVEHERHAMVLRESLVQSIQTIAATVEARDPYTAGHQQRVAGLATAMARKMELPEEQVDAIALAAIIHDLGKIHVPAEILSKPGKLTDVEYMLIKAHPQSGYDILKHVTFPWPIAEIILQHHERLDGSGYPQGLKKGKILLEARVIAVADVVEAMSSHRPYRPGLGLESALEEIKRHRGTWYDPDAVDACIKLFREDGYTFLSDSASHQA